MSVLLGVGFDWHVTDLDSLDDDVELDTWTDPFDPTPVWSRPDLRRFAADLPQHPLLNVVVTRCGRPLLTAPVLLSPRPGGLLFYDVPAMIGDERAFGVLDDATPALPAPARAEAYPSLALGIHGGYHGILVDPSLDLADRVAACGALLAAVRQLAERRGCRSHALLYLTPNLVQALSPLRASNDDLVVLGAQSSFGCTGASFEDYLDGLSSRRRKHARGERAGYLASRNTTLVREGGGALGADLVDLRCQLRARYGHPEERESTELEFASLARWCGDRLVVVRTKQGPDTVGFAVFLRDRDRLYGRTAGFDYDRLGSRDYCYFNIAYYEPLIWGLDHGVHSVEMGLSSYPTKRTRGCVFEPRFGIFSLPAGSPLRPALQAQDRSERARLAAECATALTSPIDMEGPSPWT